MYDNFYIGTKWQIALPIIKVKITGIYILIYIFQNI